MLELRRYDPPKLVAVGLMAAVGLMYVLQPAGHPFTLLSVVNLIPNQLGHLIFLVFGGPVSYFGGPVVQVAFPLSLAVYLRTSYKPLYASLAVFWTAQNLFDVALYAHDARALTFELFGGPDHVWNTLLGRLGLLPFDHFVGVLIYSGGLVTWVAALALGLAGARKPAL